jgi:hypothetical protein
VRCIVPSVNSCKVEGALHCCGGAMESMRHVLSSDSVNLDGIDPAGIGKFKYISSSQIGVSTGTRRCVNLAVRGAMADNLIALLNGESSQKLWIPTLA